LEAVLADEKTPWSTLTVDEGYGEGPREVDVATDGSSPSTLSRLLCITL
jgi:hypothetical protein